MLCIPAVPAHPPLILCPHQHIIHIADTRLMRPILAQSSNAPTPNAEKSSPPCSSPLPCCCSAGADRAGAGVRCGFDTAAGAGTAGDDDAWKGAWKRWRHTSPTSCARWVWNTVQTWQPTPSDAAWCGWKKLTPRWLRGCEVLHRAERSALWYHWNTDPKRPHAAQVNVRTTNEITCS